MDDLNLPAKHHDGAICRIITSCTKLHTENGKMFPQGIVEAVSDTGYCLDAPQYMPAGGHYGITTKYGTTLVYSKFIERV